jgi:filamentous hemagglutinin family protein
MKTSLNVNALTGWRSASRSRLQAALGVALAGVLSLQSWANPTGMSVANGTVVAATSGLQLNITASHNAAINWQSFNIGANETTTFIQPSASSVVWNRISDPNPSQIWGHLNANGIVVLMNSSGFFFGPNSFVSAAGLVVTTAAPPQDFGSGGFWQFNGPPPAASIINYGQINIGSGGSAFLIAEHVENHGAIAAPEGNIGLYAGKEVLLSERSDGRGLSVQVRLPEGSVDNTGRLVADGGAITLRARTVNQRGIIEANSVRERDGIIELVATESVNLEAGSALHARGDSEGFSSGGQILVRSDGRFRDESTSEIDAGGGAQGGDGGRVEISAPSMTSIKSRILGEARVGWTGGKLFIDPTDIFLSDSGSGTAGSGTVNSGDLPDTLRLDVNSAFVGFSQITLQAIRNIALQAGTQWDLNQSTGVSAPGSRLTLQAGNDIHIENGASLVAGQNWSVSLFAGADFASPDTVVVNQGGIYFEGTGSLQASDGMVHLLAGNEVIVNSGFIRTVGGGNIDVVALSGSVNTGTRPNGFLFRSTGSGYDVDPDLGGISTMNGGNVNITAGQDIVSFLPQSGDAQQGDGGSGAFGAAAGNVTLTAGRNVAGHYVVRSGIGRITAGANAGTPAKSLALSLGAGGWDINAVQDILLQEVRNPNGVFNAQGFFSASTRHRFDYASDAYTHLTAGHAVELLGTSLPRNSSASDPKAVPVIYPPSLEISAGAGGVTLDKDIVLFPSMAGQLRITTFDGGALKGNQAGSLVSLIMSDSGRTRYTDAGNFGIDDHADTPVHLNDPDPVKIDISGNLSGVLIATPKQTQINVGGDMINARFVGQNLHESDVTSINVAGDIRNRNEFTTVPLGQEPDLTLFDHLDPTDPSLSSMLNSARNAFFYDSVNHTLTYKGRINGQVLQALLNMRVVRWYPGTELPVLDEQGIPIIDSAVFCDPAALQSLYANSQDVPTSPDTGYKLGGPGQFNIAARNLDLGATAGIVSYGPRNNQSLAKYSSTGAGINLTLSGNLDMFSTTISSLAGGDIHIHADGSVNVGSRQFVGNDINARGIFTVARSDVEVIATGDINVNGSRIAAYDGGDVIVKSLEGNVDAGNGAAGSVSVEKIYVDPDTHEVKTYIPRIPGSGILATTFPPSLVPSFPNSTYTVGDITVETPRGNIIASAGGIVQIPYNGVNTSAGTVTLKAGSKDAQGNVLYQGAIDASGSGVIGSHVVLDATAGITGLVFARQNIDISARENVNIVALAQGSVNVEAGGKISGTIVGIGSVSASGGSIDAALLSQNVNASGTTSGQLGFAQTSAAGATSQSVQNNDEQVKKTVASVAEEDEDETKKKNAGIRLAKTTGRVTVILPKQ